MSKLFENKQQIIHIATEIIALIAITFYFSQKNKKLMTHIEDLAQRIEEQEETLQKHDKLIQKMSSTITTLQTQLQQYSSNSRTHVNIKNDTPKKPTIHKTPKVHFKHPEPIILKTSIDEEEENKNGNISNIETRDTDEPVEEENLDKELEAELEDLEEENIELINLESI